MSNKENIAAAKAFVQSIPKDQMTPVPMHDTFWDVKVGDTVTRNLANVIKMKMRVNKVTERLIHVSSVDGQTDGWTFDRSTGIEIDEELGWTLESGVTGSFLVKEPDEKAD